MLTDSPVHRELVDSDANIVSSVYSDAMISVNPKPNLMITRSNQTVILSWPLWATNYVIQEALENVANSANWSNLPAFSVRTGEAITLTLPISPYDKTYRLVCHP